MLVAENESRDCDGHVATCIVAHLAETLLFSSLLFSSLPFSQISVLLHWSWQIRLRHSTGLQAVGSDVALCFPPTRFLAQIKSMLGFLGQRRAFIIEYEESDTVAAPTAENAQ